MPMLSLLRDTVTTKSSVLDLFNEKSHFSFITIIRFKIGKLGTHANIDGLRKLGPKS
jgi:hypothetical protein